MIHLLAAEGEYQVFHLRSGDKLWLLFSGVTALLAIVAGFVFARSVLAEDEGTPTMREIAAAIQPGSVAAVIVYENRWVLSLVDTWRRDGARFIADGGISASDVVAALDATELS